MGKRKLKFDARKNYDRKIRKCSLMVCEVLDVEKLEQVPASAGLMTVPEELAHCDSAYCFICLESSTRFTCIA